MNAYVAASDGRLPDKLVNNMGREWREIVRRAEAGSEPSWTAQAFKHLRSGYGTVRARTMPVQKLQKLMGHSSPLTTQAPYLGDTGVQAAVNAAFAAG